MRKIFFILIIVICACSKDTDVFQYNGVEARAYIPWNTNKLFIVSDTVFKTDVGAKSKFLIESTQGEQINRRKDLPLYSPTWHLNKKGKNGYSLICFVPSLERPSIKGALGLVPFYDHPEGGYYIYSRDKNPEIVCGSIQGESIYIEQDHRKRRIYKYQ